MGDLNVEKDNPVYHTIISQSGLSDAYRIIHPEPTLKDMTFNAWKPGEGISRIDYIFTSPEFRIINAKIIKTTVDNRLPSDHFPVLLRRCFNGRKIIPCFSCSTEFFFSTHPLPTPALLHADLISQFQMDLKHICWPFVKYVPDHPVSPLHQQRHQSW